MKTIHKLNYVLHFFWYKFMVLFECKKGTFEMFMTEVLVLLDNIFRFGMVEKKIFKRTYFETIFGKFYTNPSLICTYTISPAFERIDIDYLLTIMKEDLKKRKKVLFVDVGAYIGLYTVVVGNAFKKYHSQLDIIAFEPEANNFPGENFKLLNKNIKANKINNVTLYKVGVGVADSSKLNKFGISTKKIDTILGKKSKKYDTVFMKIDIEGQETDALMGAQEFIKNSKRTILLVEDFIDMRLNSYLKKSGFIPLNKPSLKNSFWINK